ncbi:MAG: glycosyltransferase family 2 protein [Gemmatimonadota bacterium]
MATDEVATMRAGAPLVSVVTPVYNGARYLERCIASVREQTYERWEYVILDNASTDRTGEIARAAAEADPRIRVERNDETLPYIRNWNRAVRLISPESAYCKIVHADDWLFPACLERMVELAERHPEAGIVGSWVRRGDEVMCRWDGAPGEVIPGRDLARLALMNEIPYLFGSPSTLLLRSGLVREREALYEDVGHPLVDQHLCHDLLRRTDFGYVREVLSFTRLHEGSITAAQEETNEWFAGKLALLDRFGPEFLSPDERARAVGHYLGRYRRFLATQVGRRRGREFWSHHRAALAAHDFPLRPGMLALQAARLRLGSVRARLAGRPGSPTSSETHADAN